MTGLRLGRDSRGSILAVRDCYTTHYLLLFITVVQIVLLSKTILSPDEDLKYAVETSRSMIEVITQCYRETNDKQIPLYS